MVRKIVVGTLSTVLWWALAAPVYAAAGDGEKVGENIGNLLGGWARSLYVGIPAIVRLMFLPSHRFARLGVFMLAAVLVGGFVMAPASIAGVVNDIWTAITG